MAFRFRKSFRIIPGVRLNFGKKSVGVSVGNKWGGVTFNSKNGTTYRASVPGTGASVTHNVPRGEKTAPQSSGAASSSARSGSSLKGKIVLGAVIALLICGVIGVVEKILPPASAPVETVEPVRAISEPVESVNPVDLAPYLAPAESNIYHKSDCPSLTGKNPDNFSQFLTAEAAAVAGFAPHAECLPADAPVPAAQSADPFIASVLTKKYHHKSCVFAAQINPKNRIDFESTSEAEQSGYEPCKNCID